MDLVHFLRYQFNLVNMNQISRWLNSYHIDLMKLQEINIATSFSFIYSNKTLYEYRVIFENPKFYLLGNNTRLSERQRENREYTLIIAIFVRVLSCLLVCRYYLGCIMLMLGLDLAHLRFCFIRLLLRSYFLACCRVGLILMFWVFFGKPMRLRLK